MFSRLLPFLSRFLPVHFVGCSLRVIKCFKSFAFSARSFRAIFAVSGGLLSGSSQLRASNTNRITTSLVVRNFLDSETKLKYDKGVAEKIFYLPIRAFPRVGGTGWSVRLWVGGF